MFPRPFPAVHIYIYIESGVKVGWRLSTAAVGPAGGSSIKMANTEPILTILKISTLKFPSGTYNTFTNEVRRGFC